MEGFDAALGEDQGVALCRRHLGRRLLALGLGDTQALGVELDLVELPGVVD